MGLLPISRPIRFRSVSGICSFRKPTATSTRKAALMKKFFENFNGVSEFNYSVHISDEFRFVYFNNPKCACTTIKASLNLACATALGRDLQYANIAEIHDRSRNLLLTPAEIGYSRFLGILADTSYFK